MEFTSKQKEIVARKMGYDGPMQMFDEFLSASPSDAQRYSSITSKFAERMAKGGMVQPKKMFTGGIAKNVVDAVAKAVIPNAPYSSTPRMPIIDEKTVTDANSNLTETRLPTINDTGDAPTLSGAPAYNAATTTVTPGMTAEAVTAGPAYQASLTRAATPTALKAPTPVTAAPVTAAAATPAVTQAMEAAQAAQGAVAPEAQVQAVTQEPTTTAVSGVQAAQGEAAQVVGAPTRVAQAGEMVTGPAVDMAKVEQTLAQQQAAQGVVTEEMTVQGQLNKMLTNFDAGNPPPWAASSLRAATAQMAARGLGASSLAGQAIIQAALEAATPIAAADAKVFETMGLTNLSNRQQMAVLTAQERAKFLGQEFDQAFQTRVINAARIADIADKNFDAQTSIALENSRLANSMNIANLSAKNALVLEQAAAMSRLETQNLNNRQQAAVQNAQSFLQMDIANLSNQQQMNVIKAQSITQSILSDTAAANAAMLTNATNKLDADKLNSQLALSAQQFNISEKTKVDLANASAANELSKFTTQQLNARQEFNANMATQINIANAKMLAEVSTANTAAINAANAVNAKNATDLTSAAYTAQMQVYRDLLETSWKTGESEKDRYMEISKATISANATIAAKNVETSTTAVKSIGDFSSSVLTKLVDKYILAD